MGGEGFRRFSAGDGVEDRPSPLLRVNSACPLNCPFCNFPQEGAVDFREPGIGEVRTFARKVVEGGGREVVLSGGEPILRRDLPEVVEALKGEGVESVEVQTAGTLLTREIAASLKRAGLDKALIPLMSHDPKIQDILMGKEGAFPFVMEGISNLLEHDILTILNPVQTALNYRGLPGFTAFVAERFPPIRFISLSVVQPSGRCERRPCLIPPYDEITPFVKEALSIAEDAGIRVNNPFCGLPLCCGWEGYWNSSVEFWEGVAERLHYPEWGDGLQNRGEKGRPPQCSPCLLKFFCRGAWMNYLSLFGPRGLNPPKELFHPFERGCNRVEPPGVALIRVGISCNNACPACPAKGEGFTDDPEEVRGVLATLPEDRLEILFCGREPTLLPWLPGMVEYARDSGFYSVGLVTNGRRLSYPAYSRELVKRGVNNFIIRLHSLLEKKHDGATRVEGSFRETLRGVMNLTNISRGLEFPPEMALEFIPLEGGDGELPHLPPFLKDTGFSTLLLNLSRTGGVTSDSVKGMEEACRGIGIDFKVMRPGIPEGSAKT